MNNPKPQLNRAKSLVEHANKYATDITWDNGYDHSELHSPQFITSKVARIDRPVDEPVSIERLGAKVLLSIVRIGSSARGVQSLRIIFFFIPAEKPAELFVNIVVPSMLISDSEQYNAAGKRTAANRDRGCKHRKGWKRLTRYPGRVATAATGKRLSHRAKRGTLLGASDGKTGGATTRL